MKGAANLDDVGEPRPGRKTALLQTADDLVHEGLPLTRIAVCGLTRGRSLRVAGKGSRRVFSVSGCQHESSLAFKGFRFRSWAIYCFKYVPKGLQMRFPAGRVLLATAAIGLAGGVFGEQALAVELPTPPAAPELPAVEAVETVETVEAAESVETVETVEAIEVPAVPAVPAPTVPELPPVQEAVTEVERTVRETAQPQEAESAVAAPAPVQQPSAQVAVAPRVAAPARRDPRPTRAAQRAVPKKVVARTDSPSTRTPERIEGSFLPEAAGAAEVARPSRIDPPAGAGETLLQDAAVGGQGTLSVAFSMLPGIAPDAALRLVPASILLRETLATSFLERPG